MKIIKPEDKYWQDKEGYSKKIFLDELDLKHLGALFQEIKIKAGNIAENHYHKVQTEVFYFLTDNGYWIINEKRLEFKVGDILVIEPEDRHATINKTNQDYIYLAFKIKYEPTDIYWEK